MTYLILKQIPRGPSNIPVDTALYCIKRLHSTCYLRLGILMMENQLGNQLGGWGPALVLCVSYTDVWLPKRDTFIIC